MDDSRAVLHHLPLLGFLPTQVKQLVVDSFVAITQPFGSLIVKEQDSADAFYVLAAGKARVFKTRDNGEELPLNVLRPGDSFGEIGLLEHTTRTASVRASSTVTLFRLDRSVFQALLQSNPEIKDYLELQFKHRSLNEFFRLHSPFARLPIEALRILVTELEPVEVSLGELVIRQGDEAGPMYVIEEGRLRVFTDGEGQRQYRAYLRKGDYFGEMSLFKGIPRTASVEAVSPCRLLKFAPQTFERLVRDYPAFKAQIEERIAQYEFQRVARVPLDFAQELLPAEAATQHKVGPDHLDKRTMRMTAGEAEALASKETFFVKKPRRQRGFPHIYQVDEMDCGAACLAMVCRDFGRNVSLARIRQLVHTSLDGTSLKALCSAATELGLAARSLKSSPSQLAQLPLPAIVHWEGNHWLVLYDVAADHVRVADPALGLRRLPRAEFEQRWTGWTALFDYTPDFEKAPEGQSPFSWLWPFFRPFAATLGQALLLALLVIALQMSLPVFIQVIVDRVLGTRDAALLHMLMLGMAAVLFFMTLAMIAQCYLLSFAAVRIDAATLDFMTRRLFALPLGYFHARRTGEIQRKLAATRQVREFLVQNGVRALTAIVQVAAAVALMFVYSRPLALVFLIMAPLYALLMLYSNRWLRPILHSLDEAFSKYHSRQVDALKGIETVKALGAEGALRGSLLEEFQGIARRQFLADFTIMCYEGAVPILTFLSLVLFFWVGAHEVMQGALTVGGLVAFSSLVALANSGIGVLLPLWDNFQYATVLLNRLHDVFEQEPEQAADPAIVPVRSLEGRIQVRNLGFQYGGPEAPRILEGINLEMLPGKRLALVGRSGSGKTTLAKLLAGLLAPTQGEIFYDGVERKTLNARDLRRQIGLVLQENYLFNDSIARNIAFGEEPNMDDVLWSARMAHAHEFVERLPLGYETRVGETGIALSGGQRQRLAIARALYHRPPVLILDEATSALDPESERAVQENLEQLLVERTALIVAHRLRAIRDAEVIVVLEKGKIVEQGTHEQLMNLQGLYFYLCSQQLQA